MAIVAKPTKATQRIKMEKMSDSNAALLSSLAAIGAELLPNISTEQRNSTVIPRHDASQARNDYGLCELAGLIDAAGFVSHESGGLPLAR